MKSLSYEELLDSSQLSTALNERSIQHYQQALAHGRTLLAEFHLEGGNAAELGAAHSWLLDQILTSAWHNFKQNSEINRNISLIAAGGYGREELNLSSDIDLLILLNDKSGESPAFAEQFIQFCWDIGIKVGHSIRTINQCIDLAKQDISVMTNLMETRLLAGDVKSHDVLQQRLRSNRIWPASKYFNEKWQEQAARHQHFGDTAYNLEPNIKESKGGLRDIHMISWVANRYFGTSDLAELVAHNFLTQSEYKSLILHRDFLWRLRNGLHILSGRCEDRLLFDHQNDLALQLGYEKGANHLAVEQMMKDYYRTAKEIQLLNELLLQNFQEAILDKNKATVRKINPRFQSVGSFIETTNDTVFQDHPVAILEIFLLLQQRSALTGIRASTVRQLRANLHLIDDDYCNDPEHLRMFLNVFRYQTGLTHALRRMSAYGVLGAFFPAFGRVVGQMQHDLFHIYTVDAHSLFVLGNLRRLALPEYRDEFPELSTLLNQQNNRERLYLAALCHDIGKGSGRDHSEVGEEIALAFCKKLGLSTYDAELAAWLVRQHLVMSWTAQREDITDPRVIDRFAEVVGDQEHLDNLYLLTFADIRGTSPKVWSEWKGKLLANLYRATSRRLRTGLGGAQAITERIEARKNAIRSMVSRKVTSEHLETLWSLLADEYFLRNGPGSSAWHAEVIATAGALDLPLVAMRSRPDINAHQVLVLAADSEMLLPRVTGGLDRLHFNILDARIHPTKSGLSLLVFIGVSPDQAAGQKKWQKQFTEQLKEMLIANQKNIKPAERMLPRTLKQFKVTTRVSFNDTVNYDHTVMEVVSQDRPGLLYQVAIALNACKVRLISAKVSTVGERAEDTFFITDRDGKRVESEAQRETLKQHIIYNLEQTRNKNG